MDYSDVIEEMERFDEAEIWCSPEHTDYKWEFYAIEEDEELGGFKEYIGHGDDPVEAYHDAMENMVEVNE